MRPGFWLRTMAKSILIVGPQGCGKTLHAEALRQHFDCLAVHDNWQPSHGIVPGALMLTNRRPGGGLPYVSEDFDAYEFDHAMRLMNAAHESFLK
jgi:DNA polymerase III delta prime subunit